MRDARAQYATAEADLAQGLREFYESQAALTAARAASDRADEAFVEAQADLVVMLAQQECVEAEAERVDAHLAAIARIRTALPALERLWDAYPGLAPTEKFQAAELALEDLGLIDGDLEHLALCAQEAAVGRQR
ncbi:hypothetical protein [Streptomyces chrestomyceticus]|uniref:hypothetical protein n=1 Tax=Streptomyces chrestomyceticus TaxID=68185 RepID=UPI0033C68E17